jgi:uncharacterized protein (TIGR00369 family)
MNAEGLITDETGAQRLIGYVLDVGQQDRCARCHLSLTDQHLNRHGVLNGGIATAMLDNALGATASLTVDPEGRAPFLTISLSMQFVAPARKGAELTATGHVVGGGRALLFLDGTVRDADGTLIATATGVFKRVPQDRLAPTERKDA